MDKINFQNGITPLNDTNLNQMQDNMEKVGVVVSPTEPTTNEKVWIQKGKNLLNKDNANIIHYYLSSGALASWGGAYTLYIPCQPNTTYTIQKIVGYPFEVWTTSTIPVTGVKNIDYVNGSGKNSVTITTSKTAKYLCVYYYNTDCSLTEEELRSSIQIELGSTATEYEAYVEKAIHTKNDNGVYEEFYNENDYKIETVTTGTGTAIKFPDGTMICSGTVYTGTIENSAWNDWGSLKSVDKSLSIDFPVKFISKPNITATNSVIGNNYWIVRCLATESQITSLSMSRGSAPSTSDYGFSYTAIGRWK